MLGMWGWDGGYHLVMVGSIPPYSTFILPGSKHIIFPTIFLGFCAVDESVTFDQDQMPKTDFNILHLFIGTLKLVTVKLLKVILLKEEKKKKNSFENM